MFGFYEKKKTENKDADKNKEKHTTISSGILQDNITKQMTAKADAAYLKPGYNPQTRKTCYDNNSAHIAAKKAAFFSGKTVTDPYGGQKLLLTKAEAQMRHGSDWQKYLAEADHIDPLNQVTARHQYDRWTKTEDIKAVANDPDNLQIVSRRTNQTNNTCGKGGSSQEAWSRDTAKMQNLGEQSGRSAKEVAKQIRKTGKAAVKNNERKLARTGAKNMLSTAHESGKAAVIPVAVLASSISGSYNVVSYINGEKTISEALVDVGKDTVKGSAYSYVNVSIQTTVNHTLAASKSELLQTLGKNNVPGKVVTTVAVAGDTVFKWTNGEITTGECIEELGDKGCSFAGSYWGGIAGGALAGQLSFPVPIVGAILGSIVGGVATSGLYQCCVNELHVIQEKDRKKQAEILRIQQEMQEQMMRHYAELQRRKEVQMLIRTNTEQAALNSIRSILQSSEFRRLAREFGAFCQDYIEREQRVAECVLLSLQLQEYRRQLQEYTEQYFSSYRQHFSSAFEFMDSCLAASDYDGAIYENNQIAGLFGAEPVVRDTADFKRKIFGTGNISF